MRVRLPNPLAALDDRALLARFAGDRDQPAFEQLVKRHGRLVFGVCRRLTRNDADAEDAFQAVFLVLARDPRRAAEASSVGGWLFGVARRVGLAARRHEQRRERRERAAHPTHDDSTAGEFDDLLRVLDDELAALPGDLRAALVACFLQERTQDEAARELGWSLSTLRRRLDRGKELLRARLTRRGVTLATGLLAAGIGARATAAPPLAPPSPTALTLAAEVTRSGAGLKLLAVFASAALAVGGVAFGLTHMPADAPEPLPTPKVTAPLDVPTRPVAPAPRPVEPRKWATVSGRVVFERGHELPKLKLVPLDLIKDADVWKPFGPLAYTGTTISPDTRGVADAIVFLRPDSDDRKADFPADRIHPDRAAVKPLDRTVTIAGPHFAPRIVVARAGDRLVFENKLPVAATVAYTATGDPGGNPKVRFNVMLARGDSYTSDPLTATVHVDQFANHIHPWMDGFVWAFDHPYFAVTDASGRFELPDVPVGAWRLVAWHQVAGWSATGRLGTKVIVPADRDRRELDPITLAADHWPK